MMHAVATLTSFVCVGLFWVAGSHVHAGTGVQVATNAQEPSPAFRYRSDHYRDPFVPKAFVRNRAGSSPEGQDVSGQAVKVVGTMVSGRDRWATLEFEDGQRVIVTPGQVIAAYSRIVKRITEQGVTLSAMGDKGQQAEKTYWLDKQRGFGGPRSGGDS